MYIVVALTITVGVAVFSSNRNQKGRFSAMGLSLAILGAASWVLFIQLFRNASNESDASFFHQIFAVTALAIPFGCLLYAVSLLRRKALAITISVAALLISVVVGGLILLNDNLFYSNIVISKDNNYSILADSPVTAVYFSVFGVFFISSIIIIIARALRSKNAVFKQGLICLACCLILSSSLSSATNIILPIIGQNGLFWVGPLSVSITMLFAYFITLRYKLFINSSRLLRYLTYLVAVTVAAMIYTCLFFVIFGLIFRGAKPSNEIIIFNFITMIIIILLMPSINSSINRTKKLISENGVAPEVVDEEKISAK
jgi:hypothetical protein